MNVREANFFAVGNELGDSLDDDPSIARPANKDRLPISGCYVGIIHDHQ